MKDGTSRPGRWFVNLGMLAVLGLAVVVLAQQRSSRKAGSGTRYQAQLGRNNAKIRRAGGKVFVWAGPRAHPPGSSEAQWYDFTGAPFAPEELQFGIGKDSIRAIDDPLFVKPDDPRLLRHVPPSPYRPNERPTRNDEIRVIGFARGADVRAYPIALLDGHELVNDRVGGKPVTVGW